MISIFNLYLLYYKHHVFRTRIVVSTSTFSHSDPHFSVSHETRLVLSHVPLLIYVDSTGCTVSCIFSGYYHVIRRMQPRWHFWYHP